MANPGSVCKLDRLNDRHHEIAKTNVTILHKTGEYPMKLLTLQEAADRLSISLPTIRSWVWQRKIEIVRIGRCVRIREEVINELIRRNTVPPSPPSRTE